MIVLISEFKSFSREATVGLLTGRTPSGPIDFDSLLATLAERLRPFGEKAAEILLALNVWFQREVQRPGAVIEGGAPDEVNQRISANTVKRQEAARAFYCSHKDAIGAELRQRVELARTAYMAAVVAMDGLRQFEVEHGAFAVACGVVWPPSLGDRVVDAAAFRYWDQRVTSVLNPPTPAPIVRAADNRLVLSD